MPGIRMQHPGQDASANMKRAHPTHSEEGSGSAKRRKIFHHQLNQRQPYHVDPMLAPQDDVFFGAQLNRAICTHLSAIGFDSVKPTALEMFRAQTEAYMLHFLAQVKQSMSSCRRAEPIPQDFVHAFAQQGIKPSSLLQHLDLPIPPEVTQPAIPAPPPQEESPPNLEGLLGPELSGQVEKEKRTWIPNHFPAFPSKHTWQSTPVYTEREQDPRKIRERVTEEAIMTERTLRGLMLAKKKGEQNKVKKTKPTRQRQQREKNEQLWASAIESIQKEERDKEAQRREDADDVDFGFDSSPEQPRTHKQKPVEQEDEEKEGALVNYERKYWRKAAQSDV